MEKLVSPSQWSKRSNVVKEHVESVTKESDRIRKTIQNKETRFYGDKSTTKLDIFGLKNKSSAPLFVYISGGYWQDLSGDISLYPVQPLYDEGIVCVIVDYTRAPKVSMDEIIDEIIDAAKLILDIAIENGSKSIILSGHSAGSQLCSMILTSEWYMNLSAEKRSLFKAVFHLSGIYSLDKLVGTYVNDSLHMDLEMAQRLSPLNAKNLKRLEKVVLPYAYVIVGERDSPLFIEQAQEFVANLVKMPNIKELHYKVIPKMDHFNLVEDLQQKNYEITKNILYLINKLE
ncbi:kynurenine formamidase [Lepeophtheirus salmonis]|uniref:kynurenine formamidase n=1 Tax=Lepeophtheirus salmonis TaxID=72036 RepID=UPI001AE72735|nr:kynurenine formamidase-like [Lepeophtheirus salmonis]XP_040569661.1 kynurenine formamidase-like [Lepeophtheirus salmonis]XP_040569662.1 kynurenine formamidase-like [Lepeophtheirus salmonis]XP_040569663.1 kynurenine formamidase-like [Lepeophtheirus salmonis]XP_040569664.1 kynurenine formamidase-like [Lepeophtheirus salmonis]